MCQARGVITQTDKHTELQTPQDDLLKISLPCASCPRVRARPTGSRPSAKFDERVPRHARPTEASDAASPKCTDARGFLKVYDSMLLVQWQVMRSLDGLDLFLHAVQVMYAGVTCMVNIGECVRRGSKKHRAQCFFASCKGVEQGCHLSSTLLSIFINRFHFMVTSWAQGLVGSRLCSGSLRQEGAPIVSC